MEGAGNYSVRVAHLLRKYDPAAWGGTESAVLELLKGLREHGVESVVFAPRLSGSRASRGDADPFQAGGFEVKRFGAFLPTLGLSEAARERSVAVGGNIMSLSAPWLLWREPGIDLIHSHALGRLGGIAESVARARKIPCVLTIHGGYLDLPDSVRSDLAAATQKGIEYGQVFGALVGARRVVEQADAVITCNPREAELLTKKFPARRVSLMPHGIPLEVYAPDHREAARKAWPQIRERRVILCVGRIDAVKNQAFLVDALAELRTRYPDVLLVLAGAETDAAHAALVRGKITELGLENHVCLVGGVAPRSDTLVGLYQCAELVVLPSLSETFGLVILEAWAAGTPVIATPTSGARQLIEENANGLFFRLEEPKSFEAGVRRIFESPADAERFAGRGQALAREQYAAGAVAARFKALYEEVSLRYRGV